MRGIEADAGSAAEAGDGSIAAAESEAIRSACGSAGGRAGAGAGRRNRAPSGGTFSTSEQGFPFQDLTSVATRPPLPTFEPP